MIADEAPFSQFAGMIDPLRQGGTLPDRAACIALSGRGFHGQRNRAWPVWRGNLHLVVHFAPRRPLREIGQGFTPLPALRSLRGSGRRKIQTHVRSLPGSVLIAH